MAPTKGRFGKIKPKRHHGWSVLLFILGTLFPPLAVAARFGIGSDFWLNLLLTICGYIPGHGHNFYIQNIRNNKNHARTPKWAQRYGLVDTTELERKKKKSEWANRYQDRLPNSTLEGQPYEEGQEHTASADSSSAEGYGGPRQPVRQGTDGYWKPQEEHYYGNENGNNDAASTQSSSRWHYPANFEDAATPSPKSKKKSRKGKEGKKDRWERTEDAYVDAERKRVKKKKSKASIAHSSIDSAPYPEDAEGGLYGNSDSRGLEEPQSQPQQQTTRDEDIFNHEF